MFVSYFQNPAEKNLAGDATAVNYFGKKAPS